MMEALGYFLMSWLDVKMLLLTAAGTFAGIYIGAIPGLSVTMDLEQWDMRRQRILALLEVASGQAKFSAWVKHSESISASKSEKLEYYLKVMYGFLEDILLLREGIAARRNPDLSPRLSAVAQAVSFDWIRAATARTDELVEFARRNVQKGIALDAFAVELRKVR